MQTAAGGFLGLIFIVGAVLVTLVIFFAMREVWCWYWKLNDLVGELRLIRGVIERAEQRAVHAETLKQQGPTGF